MTVIIPIIIIAVTLAIILRPDNNTIKERWIAILVTTVPLLILFAASLIIQSSYNPTGDVNVSEISNILFIIGSCLTGAVLLATIGFITLRRIEIAKGLGFSFTVMVILSTVEFVSLEALAGV
jgi:hypothetical protein